MKLTLAVLLCTATIAFADDSSSWYGRYTGISRDGGNPRNMPRSYFNLPKVDGNYRYRWRGSNRGSGYSGNKGYGSKSGGQGDWMSKMKDMMGGSGSNGGYGDNGGNGDWMSEIMKMFLGNKGGDGNGAGDWMSKMMKMFMGGNKDSGGYGNQGGYGGDSGGDWMSKIMKMFMGNKDNGGYGGYGSSKGYGDKGGDWMSKMMQGFMGKKDSGYGSSKGYGDSGGDWMSKMMQGFMGKKDSGYGSSKGYGDSGGDWMSKMMQGLMGNGGRNGYDGNALYKGVGYMTPGAVDLTRWGMRTVPKISGDYAYTWKGDNLNAVNEEGNAPAVFWKMIAKNLLNYEWGKYAPGQNKYDLPAPMYWTMDTVGENPYKWTKNPSGDISDWFKNSMVPSAMSGDWKWRGDYDDEAFDFTGLSEDEAWAKWFTDMMNPRTMEGDWDWAASRRSPRGYDDGKGMMQKMFKYLMEKNGGY